MFMVLCDIAKKVLIMGRRFFNKIFACMLIFIYVMATHVAAVVIGSNTTVSVQGAATFPVTDSNNTMLGFAAFSKWFYVGQCYHNLHLQFNFSCFRADTLGWRYVIFTKRFAI